MESFEALEKIYPYGEIWIVASGPSAGFVDPDFFRDKITLAVNYAWRHFTADYVILKENYAVKDALEAGERVVASRWHCGDKSSYQNKGMDYVFDHPQNGLETINLDPVGNEARMGLVVSYSTITSAIHLAAWMGAKTIMLVGHDCGMIDGQLKMEGYNKPDFQKAYPDFYKDFIGKIEPQTLALKKKLSEVYQVNIYSLNPWINFGLEGHRYERVGVL